MALLVPGAGEQWTPCPTPQLALVLALCEDVHRNGLFLGGKPACLGQFPCQVRVPTSKRSRMPLMNNSRQTLLGNGEGAPCV